MDANAAQEAFEERRDWGERFPEITQASLSAWEYVIHSSTLCPTWWSEQPFGETGKALECDQSIR